jgi:hypothetical protein
MLIFRFKNTSNELEIAERVKERRSKDGSVPPNQATNGRASVPLTLSSKTPSAFDFLRVPVSAEFQKELPNMDFYAATFELALEPVSEEPMTDAEAGDSSFYSSFFASVGK